MSFLGHRIVARKKNTYTGQTDRVEITLETLLTDPNAYDTGQVIEWLALIARQQEERLNRLEAEPRTINNIVNAPPDSF